MKPVHVFALGVVALSSFPSFVLAQDSGDGGAPPPASGGGGGDDTSDGPSPPAAPVPSDAPPANVEGPAPPSLDPDLGCTPYFHQQVADALSFFPPVWQAATIVPGDTNARNKWESIRAKIPDIPPKGTIQGDWSALNYSPDDTDCWWTWSKCTKPKRAGIPEDVDDVPEPNTVGYNFDDGPNCSHNTFYDYLKKQNQRATMFFIGSNVMNWPLEALRAYNDGHEICIHSWSHHYMTGFESEDAFAELYYSVKLVAGVTPTCWRPPFGDVDDRIRAIASGLGLATMMWEWDSNDWQEGINGVTSAKVDGEYEAFINAAKNGTFATKGAIFLAHELNAFTMNEAIKYYPAMKAAFQNIVPIGVAWNITRPYVEQNVTQPNFEQYVKGLNNLLTNTTANPGAPKVPLGGVVPSVNNNAAQPQPTGDAQPRTGDASALVLDFATAMKALATMMGILLMSVLV